MVESFYERKYKSFVVIRLQILNFFEKVKKDFSVSGKIIERE